MGLLARVKTWASTEDVTAANLNAEFDNILDNLTPAYVDDYSTNASQMQTTADPGEVGSESLATTLAGELARLRHMIKEITGESIWYSSPSTSLTGLANSIGTGLQDNRLVSGRVRTSSEQPIFLVPNGAARTVKLDGTPTNFIYYVEGSEYTISSDVTLTNLTAAPSSNNTCLINDTVAADQYWTKYAGEDGSEIPVDTMGTEITALVGKFAGFKLNNGSADEYFIAYVDSATRLTKARRGFFFDSSDAPVPRVVYANNDTITLMKLTWIFAKTDGTLTATYTNPVWSDDEPSSPAVNDYWFDYSDNKWKRYDVASFVDADAILVGICLQDTSNCVAARSFEFFKGYEDINTIELYAESNSQAKSRYSGASINVWGSTIKNDRNLHTWDMTLDLESGVTEASSTYYYFYVTEDGDKVISDKKPHDRREDLFGYYHPSHSWRCVGRAFNDGSSNLTEIESYYRSSPSLVVRAVAASDLILPKDEFIVLSGASATYYLPPAALNKGKRVTIKHAGTSLTQVYTLDGYASETISPSVQSSQLTYALYTAGETVSLLCDGSNWHVIGTYTQTAPASYTPVVGTGFGTITDTEAFWWREGRFMCSQGAFRSGTVTTGHPTLDIPVSQTLDTAKIPNLAVGERAILGHFYSDISTTATDLVVTQGPYCVTNYNSNQTTKLLLSAASDIDQTTTGTFFFHENVNAFHGNASGLTYWFRIPITGWNP